MFFGKKSIFGLETEIHQIFKNKSFYGLGFFLIYLNGKAYGVRKHDATMLGCSYDSICKRIKNKGTHVADILSEKRAIEIANEIRLFLYEDEQQSYFGLKRIDFEKIVFGNNIIWAPDGDEAFDDGSHIIQMDCGEFVRIIGFANLDNETEMAKTVNDVYLPSNEFYEILTHWQKEFIKEWNWGVNNLNV